MFREQPLWLLKNNYLHEYIEEGKIGTKYMNDNHTMIMSGRPSLAEIPIIQENNIPNIH